MGASVTPLSAAIDNALAGMTPYEILNGFKKQPIRCHHLKAIGRSPEHARLVLSGVEEDPGQSKDIGITTHAILQGRTDIIVYRGGARYGSKWDAFKEQFPEGTRIVLDKEMKAAEAIAAKIMADKDARELVKSRGVRREETILFEYLGRQCRATPDLYQRAKAWPWIAELKTTKCSDPDVFRWDAKRLGYHVQLAMQREAARAMGLPVPKDAFIIAAENKAPWTVTVMRVEDEDLEAGLKQFHLWLEKLIACETSGHWPGYAQTVVPLRITDPSPYGADEPDDEEEDEDPEA